MSPNARTLRLATANDREALATIIRDSTNAYYVEQLARPPIFPPDKLVTTDMVDLYAALDGSECLLCVGAVEEEGQVAGQILGSCFFHVRETHVSLGIMNVNPAHFGEGVARQLLTEIIERASALGKSVRLVSSCLNLDSYSLYTRLGFAPFEFYQDMLFQVPAAGYAVPSPANGISIRPATLADLDAITALERRVSGISRATDFHHFITNPDGHWHVSVAETEKGAAEGICGVLASCASAACNMVGPGVVSSDAGSATAAALIVTELNRHPERTPVVLVPGRFPELVQALYAIGGRNCELHVGQSTASVAPPTGITLPTFLPETG